ncbi:hypothetical protein [Companilactobacillus furfuricola]|uniref:hypothetical protein n=1 Tax=Companilactobacillus furfuricola TaxID=1462575 RepID=UPI000F78ACA1|nr:hypothetical protein [Companilactobacillus furfuricola]
MKKNIKYAGIAAAALLTVAPVATPVVNSISNTNVAQAATDTTLSNTVAKYFNTLSDVSSDTGAGYTFFSDINANNYGKEMSFKSFEALKSVDATRNGISIDNKNVLENDDTVKYTISSPQYSNYADFNTRVKDVIANGGTISLKITATDGDGINESKTINFTNKDKSTEGVTSLDVNYADPYIAQVGDSTASVKHTTSFDASVTDQNGDDVEITKVQPSQNIYTTKADALSQNTDKAIKDTKFNTKDATYYQAVNITLGNDVNVNSIYNNAQAVKDGVSFTINDANAVAANVIPNQPDTIKLVRAIKVGDKEVEPSEDSWTETDAPGTVRVGNDLAHLYDDNNKLTTRSIAASTDWATDKYRTNDKTGEIQYHVSTHEWVNASDVTFYAKGDNGNGLGNVTDLGTGHVVTLDGPAGFVYTLFKSDGSNATRGLAGLTAWQTDKSATDAEGNTYYRVSTDEWVRAGSGVNFK